jgi:alkylhydroperoxidase/carboxymuconolactone decarboxylase family protein YurZ
MSREEIYKQIEEMFGFVPTFFKKVPDSSLELEWQLFKRVQFDEGPIPNKYRELIGVAVSAVTKCHYCAFYHTRGGPPVRRDRWTQCTTRSRAPAGAPT